MTVAEPGLCHPKTLELRANLKLSVPRSTPNTFLMQPFTAKAIVVRHDQSDDGAGRVAVRFEPPLDLDLEV
jgi:hypothetical protein